MYKTFLKYFELKLNTFKFLIKQDKISFYCLAKHI